MIVEIHHGIPVSLRPIISVVDAMGFVLHICPLALLLWIRIVVNLYLSFAAFVYRHVQCSRKAFSEVDYNAYSLVMSIVIVAGNVSLDPDYDQLCEERYHHAAMVAGYIATGACVGSRNLNEKTGSLLVSGAPRSVFQYIISLHVDVGWMIGIDCSTWKHVKLQEAIYKPEMLGYKVCALEPNLFWSASLLHLAHGDSAYVSISVCDMVRCNGTFCSPRLSCSELDKTLARLY